MYFCGPWLLPLFILILLRLMAHEEVSSFSLSRTRDKNLVVTTPLPRPSDQKNLTSSYRKMSRRRNRRAGDDDEEPAAAAAASIIDPTEEEEAGQVSTVSSRSPDDVADDTTCKLLYPCNSTMKEIGHVEFDMELLDSERQAEQGKGLCYKQPSDPGPNENVVLKAHCYDYDPPAEDPDPNMFKSILISEVPDIDEDEMYAPTTSFEIPERPVFRYSKYLDIDKVSNNYRDDDYGVLEFEFLDWPGKAYTEHKRQMMERQVIAGAELGALKPCLQTLEFQGRSTKYLDYICNEDEGLDIAVMGMPNDPSKNGAEASGSDTTKKPPIKIPTFPHSSAAAAAAGHSGEKPEKPAPGEPSESSGTDGQTEDDEEEEESEDVADANGEENEDDSGKRKRRNVRRKLKKPNNRKRTMSKKIKKSNKRKALPKKPFSNNKKAPLCPKELIILDAEKPEKYNRMINLMCNRVTNRDRGARCAHWPVPEGRLYLASGNKSLTNDYIHPLLIGEDVLNKLAQDPNHPDIPWEGSKKDNRPKLECSTLFSRDLRTVLDFAFARDRLILGMKCGVILVNNINKGDVDFQVAYLKSSDRIKGRPDVAAFHRFPLMINVVAATPCCHTNKLCRHLKPIVAIYSSYAVSRGISHSYDQTALKTIYVSWDNGDTFDRKVVASEDASINLIYWMYSKIPKWKVKDARPPYWVTKLWEEKQTLHDKVDTDKIMVDPATKLVLQNMEAKKERSPCDEIVSINSVSEENMLLILCRNTLDMTTPNEKKKKERPWSKNSYQIFTVRLHEAIPMVSLTRRSKRKFSCQPMADAVNDGLTIEPSLVRVPNSYSVFVIGCDKMIYASSNGGKTLFASSFYFEDKDDIDENHIKYFKANENKWLTEYPVVAVDTKGKSVIMTFGRYFAYGVIPSNSEMSFICGKNLKFLDEDKEGLSPTFVPYFNDAGVASVGVIYINLLKESSASFFTENYKDRLAIRLLDCLISIHLNAYHFYSEYDGIESSAMSETLKPCSAYKFKTNVTTLSMDIGESRGVRVSVENDLNELPLSVLLTHDKAASLEVFSATKLQREEGAVLVHEWDIVLKAKPYMVDRQTAQISAFFGSEYSNLEAVSSHLITGTEPQLRCHVQPQEHVTVRFGCSKYLRIHEDERRLQCKGFMEDFKYEIPLGHYDEDMAKLWVKERPQFYKIVNGTLHITYDYEMFGCPVEPYRLDDYLPDLRLLSLDGNPNTTEGEEFLGDYVLIEIFGATGYSYTKKVKEVDCVRPPQTLERMIREWKVRVEAAQAAYSDYPYFDLEPIFQPLNIWNRVNYEDCKKDQFGEMTKDDLAQTDIKLDEMQDSPYEIMTQNIDLNEKPNKLVWDQYLRQRVYIFLAVSVDPYGTFCNYHTFFGVSIAVPKEEPDTILILIFVGTVLFLMFIIFLGYYIRRHQVRGHYFKEAMYNRLLTAAWNLSFRYEKLLTRTKTNDPEVKLQVTATKKLKFQKHAGVPPRRQEKPKPGLTGLRHRLRQ